MRLKKYNSAAKSYRRANMLGFKLLDHSNNHFRSELESLNDIAAYKILMSTDASSREKNMHLLVGHLRSLTDNERVSAIEEMSEFSTLPLEVAELLPWSTKNIPHGTDTDIDDSYTRLSKNILETERYRRELKRIKTSGSYVISKHISRAVRNPVALVKLPFSLPLLIIRIVREKRGLISARPEYSFQIHRNESNRDCILLFPTNGVGFGHFTRLLAFAKEFRKISPETEIVFFTTMPTLQILSEEGFISYHMPSRYRYKEMDPSVWNSACEEMLNLIFAMHRPRAFIFDGAYPYRGMLNALELKKKRCCGLG